MLINGIELSQLGVQLFDRIVYSNDIDTTQDWLDGDIQPTFIRQQDRFKTIKLDFLVLSANEEEAFKRISRLTSLLKKATIKFDDINLFFDVNMVEAATPTRLKNGNFIVSYTLTSGYGKGERQIYTTNANMTNAFKLTVVYYKDNSTLLFTEAITVRASLFDNPNVSLADLGIDVNKYQPTYYNNGVATNLAGLDLTYENLQNLQALIINYSPVVYNIEVNYYIDNGDGFYNEMLNRIVSFTYPQLSQYQTVGQLIGVQTYRPAGYKGIVNYDKGLSLEELLNFSPISVFYEKIEVPRTKEILITYKKENDNGENETFYTSIITVKEDSFYEGSTLKDFVVLDTHRPEPLYYNEGYILEHSLTELISFDTIETSYTVIYSKSINRIYVEYYAGVYPGWYRLTTVVLETKYKDSYENSFDILTDIGLDLDKYHTSAYETGKLYNSSNFNSYEDLVNTGVLQVYYTPINYPIVVNYYTNGLNNEPVSETITINALTFFNNPLLTDIIPIQDKRPEGYQFSADFSYDGEITLEALIQASPITIAYEEISAVRTKNIIIRYKQELSSSYSTITTNLITINEADIIGGTRLKDIINLNAYQPEYYEPGIVDGESTEAVIQYDALKSSYDVMYMASMYSTPVRYYLDKVDDYSWIGSSALSYRVIDFMATSTLYDFGLDVNAFKPSYASDGELLYNGPVNFTALRELESINILYKTEETPEDEDIDYPHRFLFLQHNDLGEYEHLHPEWTMNHAFINTGISVDDMSKLTVVMECARVDNNVPLYQVNSGYGYLFGSYSSLGAYYMRYNNQTMYGENLSGVNLYEAKAGSYSSVLTLTEDNAIGFGENTGIYASAQDGYSRVIFTYSHSLPTDSAQMPYPLYLFANNFNGSYSNGIAGIGITGCRIYYNDQMVRNFIPVQYYDKIGNQVAPSNCLYDKITKTFFEDGTGLNSFNIRDDDRYVDTNLQHKIGHCYVNYYKGSQFIKTAAIYFRGDEFESNFDLYERFLVDLNQPQYTKSGEIKNITSINVSFEGLNNQVFDVYYEPIQTVITVNYYQEDKGNRVLLKTEEVALEEKDFYQVPTFGDLVRLNKYKPVGYETNFVYPGSKVSLTRVLENSPYDIIYTPIQGSIETYQTTIKYIKKVYGVREYETIGTKIITLNQSDFRDGEYIDFWIDKNAMKPEKFYKDGTPYQWYEMDERLNSPSDLKESYTVVYMPEIQYLDIEYYTDEVDESNRIASSSWGLAIDELDPKYSYSIAEILPNEYINKYKPVNCAGGIIQGAEIPYTYEELMAQGSIHIVYDTILEPDDPTEAYYEEKIIGFGTFSDSLPLMERESVAGGTIPYIDLGYKPKELGRLRIEVKGVAQANGFITSNVVRGGWQDTAYTDYCGYRVPNNIASLGDLSIDEDKYYEEEDLGNFYSSYIAGKDKGHFSFSPYIPRATGWVYSAEGPQFIDGQIYYTAGAGVGVITGSPQWNYYGQNASFRRGMAKVLDENWETIETYKEYGKNEIRSIGDYWIVNYDRFKYHTDRSSVNPIANPITTILDGYNGYWSSYTELDSNHAPYEIFTNEDIDIFEARLQPKGTISLFRTTNPLTGKPNIMAHHITTRAGHTSGYPMALQGNGNPYTGDYKEVEYEVLVQAGTDAEGNPIFETKTMFKNVEYADFPVPVHPQINACAIWRVKIWDQDRLVRDLIPVAKDDKIYDYIMPENGMFDLITEIFFGNSNKGGTYSITTFLENENKGDGQAQLLAGTETIEVRPEEVLPFWVCLDPCYYGKITMNYYDYDYSFINNQFVNVPTWFSNSNTTFEEIVGFNDYKPDDFHLDGFLDIDDKDSPLYERLDLYELYKLGSANIWYKLKTFTKTVIYYQGDCKVGSKDLTYSLLDIENAESLADLGIDVDLYWNENFAHGEIIFNEDIIKSNNIQAFIDAPAPIVVYKKLTKEQAPNLFYVEYYRGGASDETLIVPDPDNENYFDCSLDGVVLNPNGAIKYYNHYHSALYEDEVFDYFIPYQVKVINKYVSIHRGPARKFPTLATIVEHPTLTIIEERNGWGRLKEYPVGWIMLNATEPITGPGQNPDYDIADETVATIPFASAVHISKMTIDRLWCYIPEVESWVKAMDLSFNQSGKLYNGLDIKVINLNEIDFSKVNNLNDLGIYPNAKSLYFHDKINYNYIGEYSYEAFSNLHSLEFVYPETIYNYRCLYYKDNVVDNIRAGQVAIEGEYKRKKTVNAKFEIKAQPNSSSETLLSQYSNNFKSNIFMIDSPVEISENNTTSIWYKVRVGHPAYDSVDGIITGYMLASTFDNIFEVITEMVISKTDITNYLGSAGFSCSIGDWNPDWDVFIASSWKVDENGNEIPPNLYRDTELALTWDYFGFDKNLYKPAGYPDGIYLWNPRSWENGGDIHFTFQELVRLGTQYVLYPCVPLNSYKILVDDNIVERFYENVTTTTGRWLYGYNPGVSIDLRLGGANVSTFKDCILDEPEKLVVDYNFEGELNLSESGNADIVQYYTYERQYPHLEVNRAGYYNPNTEKYVMRSIAPGFSLNDANLFSGIGSGYSTLINVSNFRKSPSVVYGFANVYEGKPYDYYIYKDETTPNIPIHYNTNLKGYNRLQTERLEYTLNNRTYEFPDANLKNNMTGLIYGAQSYQNFMLKHYWVPVPKGLWYKYNGVDLRIPENGMLDIMTGKFNTDYRMKDGPVYSYTDGSRYDVYADGLSYIFKRNQQPIIGTQFDYFENWHYETEASDLVVKTLTEIQTYNHPDSYALKVRSLPTNLILPISKITYDTANNVVGNWAFSGDQWEPMKYGTYTVDLGTFDITKLTKLQQTICLVEPKFGGTYYVYTDPSAVSAPGSASDAVYGYDYITPVYYNYVDSNNYKYYFDGAYWIPENYTSFNTHPVNKNYAIVPDTVSYYSYPVEDDKYKVGQYHYGERITVIYISVQNIEWGYTGLGWMKLNSGTVSEIL